MQRPDNLYDLQAEQSVIGGMLIWDDSDKAIAALEILRPDDFYLKEHHTYWKAICEMSASSQPIDPSTLSSYLNAMGYKHEFSYLGEVAKNTPSQANMTSYAKTVKDMSKLRKAYACAVEACEAINEHGEPEDRLNSALSKVALMGAEDCNSEFKTPVDLMTQALNRIENAFLSGKTIVGLSSGFENIDRMTGGFREADYILLAARPSMGKTTLAMNIAENVAYFAEEKGKVLVLSLEMPGEQLMAKTLSRAGTIPLGKILNGSVMDNHNYKEGSAKLSTAMECVMAGKNNILIDDKGGQHISQVMARAKRASIKMGGLDLIVIDYIQLIKADGNSKNDIITNVSAGIKELAKALKCPIICLSQLNRALTGKPELKNLRDSGSLEQDADVVMFLHDDDYEGNRGEHSLTELIFAKQRMAAIGSTFLQPELGFSRFSDTNRLPEIKQEEPQGKSKLKRYDQ